MKRILIGILLTGLGFFFSVLTVKALRQYSDSESILPTAVYVEDGAYSPENEGKLLIVCGELAPVSYVRDEELGLTLNTVGAKRVAERLVLQKNTADGDKFIWSHIVSGSQEYGIDTRDLTGKAKIGELMLSPKLITLLPMTDSGYYSDFDRGELERVGWEKAMSEGFQYYITNGPTRYTEKASYLENVHYNEWDEEGALRAHYMYVKNAPMDLTVVGVQKNGILEYEPKVMTSVIEGRMTRDNVLKDNHRSSVLGTICALVISFGLTIPGLFMLFPDMMYRLCDIISDGIKKLFAKLKNKLKTITGPRGSRA